MGCCQSSRLDQWGMAGRMAQEAFPALKDLRAQITLQGAFGFPFRARRNGRDVFVKVQRVQEYTRRVLHELSQVPATELLALPSAHEILGEHAVTVTAWESGGDLLRVLNRGCSDGRRERLMCSVLEGVHFLHSRGLVHRDLKLENVLVRNYDQCVLIDLDTCEKGTYVYVTGTANYLPPTAEVQRLAHHQGLTRCERMVAVDLYALGKMFGKMQLAGSQNEDAHYVWQFWLDRDRASPTAVVKHLRRWSPAPFWRCVWWWCVENMQSLHGPRPYLKCTDEALQIVRGRSGSRRVEAPRA